MILFVAVVNGNDSLISLSDFSLLVYRNGSDFCILTLYPATLLNSLISFSNSLIISLWLSMYSVMSCTNSESFASFLIYHWFYFSSLIAIARTSKSMLNHSGESCHPCLVLDLKGNAFSVSPLRIMFAVGLSYVAFTMWRYVPSMPIFWRLLIINGCWILSKSFLHSLTWLYGFYVKIG